ncbi:MULTISPECIES: FKBP-type peptidyl-prolyl cis-trans isomerase [unclassified Thioalkalivibrio]|uniref:FKBP-type peptidyl-prolyl cis-trans isomerase n=1 Tax=unclassified Thioalkalivibrio TaxID=2621013 RepID=UPI00036A4012|nr:MULTISPECIES: FKBP-type peptidyl-prolyl cis-trans isomerase [unclassified Thioalkalivibrio]
MRNWVLFSLFFLPAFALAQEIEIRDIEAGEGEAISQHDTALVHYVGTLEEDGSQFDSSRDAGQPLSVTPGTGQTIPGFERAILGMREGGKREVTIPPELAYGERGAGNIIPRNATLKFEIEVMEITDRAPFTNIDNQELATKLDEGVTLVDIRRPDEWAETGVVEGSHRITAFEEDGSLNPDFGRQFTELVGQDEEVVLICRVGNRTAALARALADGLGYENIYNVTDGIMEWLEDDRIVQHDCPETAETAQC